MRHHSASIIPPIIIISRPSFNTYHHQCTIIPYQSFTQPIIINVSSFRLYFTTYHHFASIIYHLSSLFYIYYLPSIIPPPLFIYYHYSNLFYHLSLLLFHYILKILQYLELNILLKKASRM